MRSELGQVCSRLSSGKGIPSSQISDAGEYPVYGGNGLRGYTDHANFEGECAIIGRQGAFCGNVRFFSGKAYMTEHAVVVCANEYSNTRYLAYLLSTMDLGRLSGQSAQPGLSVKTLAKQEIELPILKQQNRIVSILASLDDKIELNQKINQNLERQAFTLFDRFLSTEHSSKCRLSQIAIINPKRILKKAEPARYIDMAQLSTSGGFPNGWEVKPYNGGMRFSNGDTLLARITPCLENGKTAYIDFLDENEVAFGSTEYVVITSQGDYPPEFFYCLARYPAFVDYAVKNMNGSSGRQRVSAEAIGNYVLPMLTDDELSEFRSTVPCLFRAMRNNSIENMSLAQLRDALLPKLISGEIDVSTHTD